jgi:hypothetical protein
MLTNGTSEPAKQTVEGMDLSMPVKNMSSDFKAYMTIATLCLFVSVVFFVLHMIQKPGHMLKSQPWFMVSGIALFVYLVDAYLIVEKGEQFFSLKYGWFIHLLLSIALILYSYWVPAMVSRWEPWDTAAVEPEALPRIPPPYHGDAVPDDAPDTGEKGFPQSGPPIV